MSGAFTALNCAKSGVKAGGYCPFCLIGASVFAFMESLVNFANLATFRDEVTVLNTLRARLERCQRVAEGPRMLTGIGDFRAELLAKVLSWIHSLSTPILKFDSFFAKRF